MHSVLSLLFFVMIIATITYCWLISLQKPLTYIRRCSKQEFVNKKYGARYAPKPQWVITEIIKLAALYPTYSGHKLVFVFNRLYATSKGMTVSKSWVYKTLSRYKHEVLLERKGIKSKPPAPIPRYKLWQMDLTQINDNNNQPHRLLGCIDAGTRACIGLMAMRRKTSIALLRALLNLIEQYGQPKSLRTDNEACFTSKLFRFGLWFLGIKHQTTEVACPWQNGRIERFFGTLKQHTKQVIIPADEMASSLHIFRNWYNHVRPHQNLNGGTPAEAWNNKGPNQRGKGLHVNEWDGVLEGIYMPP